VGFGERAFAAILSARAEGRLHTSLHELGQIVSWIGGHRQVLGRPAIEADLDVFASPYLDGTIDPAGRDTLYVETDRGCPYSCAFCVESTAPPKVARFSIARIEAELAWAIARGFQQIELCSAILNLDTQWLQAFVEMVERIDPERRLSFSAALFTTHLDERQAELFGRLRMKSALFGLNTINPATFKGVRRVIRPDRFREKIELYARHGRPQVSMIMGLPGDTPEGLRQTLRFADTLPADLMLFRFMVLPRTLYYEQRHALRLEIDFQSGNRILATHSYTREDLRRMESIAAAAGYHEVNPGEWVRRLDHDRAALPGPMPRRTWNLLYLVLQAMAVHEHPWPQPWRHVRAFLEVERFAGITFADDAGEQMSIVVSQRTEAGPAFHRTRWFQLGVWAPHRRGEATGDREPPVVLAAFAAAFDAAERAQIRSGIPARSHRSPVNRSG
jgi:MoaA/NifB/PqqE/SkfB family radical SAM enzyme